MEDNKELEQSNNNEANESFDDSNEVALKEKNKRKSKIIILLISVLLLAIVAIIAIAVSNNNTAQSVAIAIAESTIKPDIAERDKHMLTTSNKKNFETYAEMQSITLNEYLQKNYSCNSIDDFYEQENEKYRKKYEDIVGKYTYEIGYVIEKTAEEANIDINEAKTVCASFTQADIEDLSSVVVEVKINGVIKSETVLMKYIMFKVDGTWYGESLTD